ncbi:hypothetical protein SAY86_012636 [Trapa natans]|uniref:Uncharacterized protein n=1 Tax=Trapa natans TaxID=22666 RepID=A0AAN7R9D4_TRANT|nr:hypothetical protein SAY86_012636 [Trapa natans]
MVCVWFAGRLKTNQELMRMEKTRTELDHGAWLLPDDGRKRRLSCREIQVPVSFLKLPHFFLEKMQACTALPFICSWVRLFFLPPLTDWIHTTAIASPALGFFFPALQTQTSL